jgi:hypothetical protein
MPVAPNSQSGKARIVGRPYYCKRGAAGAANPFPSDPSRNCGRAAGHYTTGP